MIGVINAHMFGAESEPGEHVDWSEPDVYSREEWRDILGMPVEAFASISPHMIVFEV